MKKVYVKNELNNSEFGASFAIDEELNTWVESCVSSNSWGKKERSLWKDEATAFELGRILKEEEILIVEAKEEYSYTIGDTVTGEIEETIIVPAQDALFKTLITVKADYIIVITDITEEHKLKSIRAERNALLVDSDKVMISDYPISNDLKAEYINYRIYLRDITELEELPTSVLSFEDWKKEL